MEYLLVHRGSRGASYLYELTCTASDVATTGTWRGPAPNVAGGWRGAGGPPPRQQNASESAELSELGGSDGVRVSGAKRKRPSYPKGVIPLRR